MDTQYEKYNAQFLKLFYVVFFSVENANKFALFQLQGENCPAKTQVKLKKCKI